VLRVWSRVRRRPSVQRDLADLVAGTALHVAAFHRSADQGRWRQGVLRLELRSPRPITWTGHRLIRVRAAEPQHLPAPFAVYSVRPTDPTDVGLKPGLFSVVDMTTAGNAFPLAVPTTDIPLLRQALTAASSP
jgi:hypothetical protein